MPTRVVVGGVGVLPGSTMEERRRYVIEQADDLRRFQMVKKETADRHIVFGKGIARDVESMGLKVQVDRSGSTRRGVQRVLAHVTGRPFDSRVGESTSGSLRESDGYVSASGGDVEDPQASPGWEGREAWCQKPPEHAIRSGDSIESGESAQCFVVLTPGKVRSIHAFGYENAFAERHGATW